MDVFARVLSLMCFVYLLLSYSDHLGDHLLSAFVILSTIAEVRVFLGNEEVAPIHSLYRVYCGFTPYNLNKPDNMKFFIEKGPEVEAIRRSDGHTPLHDACSGESVGCVQHITVFQVSVAVALV